MINRTLIGALLSLQLFVFLAIAVLNFPLGIGQETQILWAFHHHSTPFLDHWAVLITRLGIYGGTVPLTLGILAILSYYQQWRSLMFVALTAVGTMGLSYATKYAFARPRPELWERITTATSPAFPSGHALASMMLAIVLITLLWDTRWRWLTLVGSILFVLLIAWTRLYLGVHYPSDILGGWLLAIAWCLGVNSLYHRDFFLGKKPNS